MRTDRAAPSATGRGWRSRPRRLHLRRALATLLVFALFLVALAGIVTAFVRPLAIEGPEFVDRLPGYVQDARAGRGPVGGLVQRYNYDGYRGQLKPEPTIGQQQVPMSSPDAPDRPDEAPPPTLDTLERTSRPDQRSTTRSS